MWFNASGSLEYRRLNQSRPSLSPVNTVCICTVAEILFIPRETAPPTPAPIQWSCYNPAKTLHFGRRNRACKYLKQGDPWRRGSGRPLGSFLFNIYFYGMIYWFILTLYVKKEKNKITSNCKPHVRLNIILHLVSINAQHQMLAVWLKDEMGETLYFFTFKILKRLRLIQWSCMRGNNTFLFTVKIKIKGWICVNCWVLNKYFILGSLLLLAFEHGCGSAVL